MQTPTPKHFKRAVSNSGEAVKVKHQGFSWLVPGSKLVPLECIMQEYMPKCILQISFLFLKCDTGRSNSGRQMASYPHFIGGDLDWIAGPTFDIYEAAINTIANSYRKSGL